METAEFKTVVTVTSLHGIGFNLHHHHWANTLTHLQLLQCLFISYEWGGAAATCAIPNRCPHWSRDPSTRTTDQHPESWRGGVCCYYQQPDQIRVHGWQGLCEGVGYQPTHLQKPCVPAWLSGNVIAFTFVSLKHDYFHKPFLVCNRFLLNDGDEDFYNILSTKSVKWMIQGTYCPSIHASSLKLLNSLMWFSVVDLHQNLWGDLNFGLYVLVQ